MDEEKIEFEKYNRSTVCCNLMEFDPIFATESDFIEVCEWKNGEGYDITINDKNYSLTIGELEAINYLVEKLNKN